LNSCAIDKKCLTEFKDIYIENFINANVIDSQGDCFTDENLKSFHLKVVPVSLDFNYNRILGNAIIFYYNKKCGALARINKDEFSTTGLYPCIGFRADKNKNHFENCEPISIGFTYHGNADRSIKCLE